MITKSLNKFVIKNFKDLNINYIDVGSSLPLNKLTLFFKDQFNFIFFEPNYKEFLILKNYLKNKFKSFRVYNSAVSNKKSVNLYLYDRYKLSSVHKLDEKYKDIYRKIKLKKIIKLKATKLHQVIKKINPNDVFFLKIDTQGHSLPVIKSLSKKINKISCLVVEGEKVPTYEKSFNISETDLYLRKNNFLELGRINDYRWSKNFKNQKFRFLSKEFSYAEDRIYIKNIFTSKVNKYDLKLIILMCIIFDYLDFAEFLLTKFNKILDKKFILLTKKEIVIKLSENEKFIRNNLNLFYKNKISLSHLVQVIDKFSEFFSKKYVF